MRRTEATRAGSPIGRSLRQARRVLRSAYVTSAWTTIAFAGLAGISGVIAARALGPYERGLLATAVVWSSMAGALSAYGTPAAATYFVARERTEPRRATATVVAWAAVIGLAVAMLGVTISLLLVPGRAAAPLAIAFAAVVLTIPGGAGLGAVLGLGEYRAWGLLRLLGPVGALVGVLIAVASGWQTAVAIVTVTSLSTLVQVVVIADALQRKGLAHAPDRDLVRPVFAYIWRNVVSGAGWLVTTKIDLMLLTLLAAPELVGFYAVAAAFGAIIVTLASSAGQVVLRRVSAGGHEALRQVLPRALGVCLILAGGAAGVAFVTASELVPLLFGSSFESSIEPMRILMPGAVALSVAAVLGNALRALGRPLAPVWAGLGGTLTTLVLLPILLPALDASGAAIASTVSYVVVAGVMALSLRSAVSMPK